jgi:hypothetical protein
LFFPCKLNHERFLYCFLCSFFRIHSCVPHASVRWNLVLYFFFCKNSCPIGYELFLSDPNESNCPLAHFLSNWFSFFIQNIIHSLQEFFFILDIYHISWLADFFFQNRLASTVFCLFFHHISINKYKKQRIKEIIIVLWACFDPCYNIYIFLLLM